MTETAGADAHGTPAYFWRYGTAYVAWFCDPADASRWLENGEEVYSAWDVSYLSAIGHEPRPGDGYEDLGHEHCMADNCPAELVAGDVTVEAAMLDAEET